MDKHRLGDLFLQVFPKDQYWVPLLFLIYINDLPNDLKSNAKLFADDTSLFTIVKDKKVPIFLTTIFY